jgi:hypothetical protein
MEKFQIKLLEKTCDACPAQWEGITEDNRKIYIRYRWGCLSVSIGMPDDMSEFAASEGNEIFFAERDNRWDGIMDEDTLKDLTKGVLIFPE